MTVSFEQSSYSVDEGDTVDVTVTLSDDPERTITVPLTKTEQDGASSADYSGVPASVEFAPGETEQTFTFTAAQDSDNDDGESVKLGFEALPAGVSAGTTSEAIVSITDDDVPAVTVSFGQSSYSVDEGDTVDVTVTLSEDPERTVTVPLTKTEQDGASSADYSGVPASVEFAPGETEKTITFTAAQDSVDDDGESVKLTFGNTLPTGVSAETTVSAVVSITDDDIAGVTVHPTGVTIEEGDSAAYTVVLDTEPTGNVTVTVNAPANTDVTASPATLTFTVDGWDRPQEVTVAVTQDSDAEDDTAALTHTVASRTDTDYDGVSADSVAVTVTDDDKSTVFATVASYRILTRYGATTEIVLSDYLADGVTGITFTLSSCDGWRKDYYDSAVVEDERLVLESNTFGHIHGSNTQPETVCTVTGTGGGRSQDQEFRLYTVSDRTPLPLLPGALSLVEARPSEVDIRISVPQGAQDYLRLGWREIGAQPTFRVVSGVSDGTVLTITGLEQGTEYDVRASLMTLQGFDLYRAGNSGAPLSLIPDGGPGSKWIGNLASGGLGKSQTIRVMSAYRSSLSIADVRKSEDVGGMVFEVTLSEASADVVTVDWTTSSDTAETPTDYQAESGTLTFPAGDIVQTLTVTINNDMVDEEEEETFTVTLTNAVNATIEDASATGTIIDDDVPSVEVSFEQGTYTVSEGDTVDVTVTLSEDPEQSVTIPLSTANQGGASDSDYTGVPASVTFNSGETEKTFIFRAVEDNLEDGGESVKLSFRTLPDRVTAGTTDEATVNISNSIAQNSLTVTFDYSEQVLSEGGTATVIVRLSIAPGSDVTIPLTKTEQGGASSADYTGVPASVEFTSEETEQTFDFMATQNDVDDDGKSVKIGFGALLAGVSAGSTDETTMFITDDDAPDSLTVSFKQATYTVAEGDTVDVTVTLSEDPERTVIIPLTKTEQGGASSADYSGVPASVTFNAGATAVDVTFTAASDSVDDDGESVKLTFGNTLPTGVSAETTVSAVVSITDDDIAGVTVHPTGVTIEEGDSAAYTVVLDTEPTGNVTVTVNAPANTDVTASPATLTFTVDGWDRPQEVTVAVTQDSDAEDDTAALTHTVASRTDTDYDGVSADSVAVTVTDDDKSTVFATVASYRILTRYGATTEIVLSDYLADGVTGITFTLSSCDGWRKDYYDSAVVEDERLVLESNTFGHIHGSNTQPETVCTVTGTGGGRSQDQEFRLYTVSDRTPLPLLPGALSLVEARPSEVDIRISVPQGAQDYLRLGWREIGGQPTFRVVSGVSDGTVLTITGLEQGTEYDVRASLMTLQGFDLYRAGNSGAPLSLIPDGGPGSKWIGNLASGGLGKSQTIRVMSAYRSSLSIEDVREREDVGGMVFEVTLSEASDDMVTVDWTTSNDTAETPADYQEESGTLTFAAGETVQTLTVTIINDTVDEEEEETFTVTLSNAVNAGIEDASATGTITDDDVPSVRVSFEQGTYTVAEGSTVPVTVTLNADPERTVIIPITTTDQDGASSADYSGVPASVTFNAGDTEVDINFSASSDSVDDDGESVKLTFGITLPTGVSTGTTDEAVVSITDDDVPSVSLSFEQSSYSVDEGDTVDVTVTLSEDPERTVTIPLTTTDQDGASSADYSGVPASVTFNAGDTEVDINFTADSDSVDDDGESVKLTFGNTLPTGVSTGTTDEAVVTHHGRRRAVSESVSFEQSSYSVDEGDTVDVTVTLSEDPERTVTIPLTTTDQDGVSSADYSGVPANVIFVPGDTEQTFTFTADEDTIDDDGESVKLGFGNTLPTGVSAGNTDEAVVTITDDDVPSVSVSFEQSSYSVDEGDTVDVTVTLSEDPERTVTIPLNTTDQDGVSSADYSGVPANVIFVPGDTEQTFTFTAASDSVDDDGESVKLTFGNTLPTGVSAGNTDETTVSITDDDVPSVSVSFEQSSYSVDEGDTVDVTVTLSEDPERTVTVPLTKTDQDGASSADYSGVPASVEFAPGETEQTFTFTADEDTIDDDGESVKLGFGNTLPTGVSAGTTDEAVVTITDDDVPSVAVSFEQGSYSVDEGDTVDVTVTLSEDPERTVTIPLTATDQDGASSADYSGVPASVEFAPGETEQTFTFTADEDTIDDDGESVKLGFGNTLPTGVSAGTTDEAVVTITDDDVPSVSVSFEQSSYSVDEGDTVDVTVTLSEDPERTVTIPLTTTDQDGASSADYSGVPASVIFVPGDTEQTFTFTADEDTIDDDGESVKLGFGNTLPTGVSAGNTDEAVVTITDDDVPSVSVSFEQGTYTVDEGSTVPVTVTLNADPERTVIIPITTTDQDGASSADYSGVPASVTFDAGDTEVDINFTASSDSVDDDGESVKLTFGNTLPTGVSTGTTDEAVVSITDDDVPSVSVSFDQSSYNVDEGDTVDVTVTLSEDPERTVTVPLTKTDQDGASSADYSGVPASVEFAPGETEQTFTFTFTAASDSDNDDGESVKLTFGNTLPIGVSAGNTDEAVVTITDDDVPSVEVSFEQGTYTVAEGSTVPVTVTLNADPERTVIIPINTTDQDGVSSADYSGVPANVIFVPGDTEQTFTFTAASDSVDDDGESVKLTFGNTLPTGVSAGNTDETTVSITDDDVPSVSVSFEQSSYSVDEGDTVDVTVTLSEDPERTVTVPLTKTDQDGASSADYSGVPASVEFAPGETEQTFTFTADEDTIDDDGESVKLGFGNTLPTGVSAGTTDEAVVTITDDDVPSVEVSFEQGTYTVDEGSLVTVKVTLNADPERTVTIPITTTDQDGASSADYSGVPASITFNAGDTEVDINFTATSGQR